MFKYFERINSTVLKEIFKRENGRKHKNIILQKDESYAYVVIDGYTMHRIPDSMFHVCDQRIRKP